MIKVKLEEIQSLIQEKIKNFNKPEITSVDCGKVIIINENIAIACGLNEATIGEMVSFPNDIYGIIMDLKIDYVGIAILNNNFKIKEGDVVYRLKKVFEAPVGDELLGKIINPLGKDLNTNQIIKTKKFSKIEIESPNITERDKIDYPIETGTKIIDSLIPIGKGQRELIIGDRQTGKTTIAINMILNQKNKNVKCIYAAIGQKNSNVVNIYYKLKNYGAMDYTTIVNSPASESITMQYITPFVAMSIAEEWLNNGEDVLIIFDDLSKHAISYRALSLLLDRTSGREAYPGDIFYLHSRLLERACKLNKKHGGGSITAIPIIETQNGDISSYIATNVISITDGQIFLTNDLFNNNIKPSINIGLSVSRIGSNAQFKMMKQVSKSIKISLAKYNEMVTFSKFGNSFFNDEKSQKIITRGKILTEYFKQKENELFSNFQQCISLFLINLGYFDFTYEKNINHNLKNFFVFLKENNSKIEKVLNEKKEFDVEIENQILDIFKKFSLCNEL